MSRKSIYLAMAFLLFVLVFGLRAGESRSDNGFFVKAPARGEMKLRVMEGLREGAEDPARAVTASYTGSMTTIGYLSDADLSKEQEQIRKTFNLKSVRLLTEADLVWEEGKAGKTSHTFRLNGWEYVVKVTPGGDARWQPFGIEVLERTEKREKSLLDTGFALPMKTNKPIVFGFENSQGRPFFVCLHALPSSAEKLKSLVVDANQAVAVAAVAGQTASMAAKAAEAAEKTKRQEEFEKDAIPCTGDIQPPKLIKLVDPVYPDEAHKKGIEGVVILEAKIAEDGKVIDAMILRSVPGLDEAAIAAVKQWAYEPMIIKGKPVKTIFTVTVRFTLK